MYQWAFASYRNGKPAAACTIGIRSADLFGLFSNASSNRSGWYLPVV
jgi:hypothetical protein